MMQEGSVTMVTPGYEAAGDAGFTQPDQAQFEADKRAVYKHPLFPLLALLFERCEQATQSAECPNSESFNMDIQAFVQHQERDRKPFLVNDPEVDGLMIKAIQVLRIHLLELEKVQELCKDFCNRYITCLKGKMQSENLLRSDYAGFENNNNNSCHSSDSNSPAGTGSGFPGSPHAAMQVVSTGSGGGNGGHGGGPAQQQQQQQQHLFAGVGVPAPPPAGVGGGDLLGDPLVAPHHATAAAAAAALGHLLVAPTVTPTATPTPTHTPTPTPGMPATPTTPHSVDAVGLTMGTPPAPAPAAPLSAPSTPSTPASPGLIHGSTPLSQIGANPFPPPCDAALLHGALSPSPTSPASGDDDDDFLGRSKKQKRGVLPKQATSIMRSWLFQHLVHPYPTEDEKRTIAAQTNLTLLQVNNWFINARRRILQPMLDASNPEAANPITQLGSKSGNMKKSKAVAKETARQVAAHRFWPDNISALQPQLHLLDGHNGARHGEGMLSSEESEDDGDDVGSSQDEDDCYDNERLVKQARLASSDSEQ